MSQTEESTIHKIEKFMNVPPAERKKLLERYIAHYGGVPNNEAIQSLNERFASGKLSKQEVYLLKDNLAMMQQVKTRDDEITKLREQNAQFGQSVRVDPKSYYENVVLNKKLSSADKSFIANCLPLLSVDDNILKELDTHEPITKVCQLAKILGLAPATVSGRILSLEKMKLLVRKKRGFVLDPEQKFLIKALKKKQKKITPAQ